MVYYVSRDGHLRAFESAQADEWTHASLDVPLNGECSSLHASWHKEESKHNFCLGMLSFPVFDSPPLIRAKGYLSGQFAARLATRAVSIPARRSTICTGR